MEEKKKPEVDNDKVKRSLTIIGLNYVAGLVLAVFTYGQVNIQDDLEDRLVEEEIQDNQFADLDPEEEPPPPPPPPPEVQVTVEIPEEIEEVENEETPPVAMVTPPTPPPVKKTIKKVQEEAVDFPDEDAVFPGGAVAMMKFIQENINYPETSIEMNEQGRVYLQFVVEKDGSITNVKVDRGVSVDIDKEAKRVVKNMPKWKPAETKGRVVRYRCRLPINFQLN
jgi:protein TonB